jgi:hypothetical protein
MCTLMFIFYEWLWLDGSNATIKDPFEDDDVEDKHLLPQSSFVENAIVQEVHRWKLSHTE